MALMRAIDWFLRRLIPALCGVLLAIMVFFTIYTVTMRVVFLNPPFWGDTLTLLANVWLIMLAFALSIRERQSIGLQILAEALPGRIGDMLNILWSLLFLAVGLLMAIWGYQAASMTIGFYWELGNMPKWVPMTILPVSGVLMAFAALRVLIEDVRGWNADGRSDKGQELENQAGL